MMFVRESKYNAMKLRALIAEAMFTKLVDTINGKGGEKSSKKPNVAPPHQLDAEDIKRLIYLCHPDKHAGSKTACDMTAKLLKMKGA